MKFYSWNEYYKASEPIEEFKNEKFHSKDQTLKPEKGNTYVYNCYFLDIHTSRNGAAISYSISKSNF